MQRPHSLPASAPTGSLMKYPGKVYTQLDMNTHCLTVLAVVALPFAAACADSGPESLRGPQRLNLADGWLLQSAAVVSNSGTELSRTTYQPQRWYPVAVPSTVCSALIKNRRLSRSARWAERVPDPGFVRRVQRQHDLAKFSHLPDERNPWRDPWWFRTEFTCRICRGTAASGCTSTPSITGPTCG